VDAAFRSCPVVALPGYSRPLIRVRDYLALIEASTFDGRRRVRWPEGRAASRTPSRCNATRPSLNLRSLRPRR